jgi:ABC-2 type transport system permease protein
MILEFVEMVAINLAFVAALVLLMLPLGMWRQAAFAVMKRNFVGYFSNPTGYVFLCIFVLLTSFAAFWPHEFFTTNLANFDQLNKFLPYIMLIFIPAITMSIWAEERRQGTDELLLTLPAKDFDIVIGKYFAAVLVFTVSLLFSQISNYAVLLAMTNGALDNLLLFSTYLGYWFVGLAMLALGMVASFLTNNLTVGFIFGAAFNAPLAFFSNADLILSDRDWIQRLYDWSMLQRLEPFGRGLISLPSILYFLGIVALGVFLSMILIGRRHWLGGRDGTSMLWHYVARAICLAAIMVSAVLIAQHSPLNKIRKDISRERVSTVSAETLNMLAGLAADPHGEKIKINAFVSNNIPTEYVQTKYDLVNLLREFDVLGGNRIELNLVQGIDPSGKDAIDAEKRYGIRPRKIASQSRGTQKLEDVVMGAAFQCGLERVVIPFFPYGMLVEYELMRSINTVAQPERKTIGIVTTDLFIEGGALQTQEGPLPIPTLKILGELAKQYDLELVRPSAKISDWLDQPVDAGPTDGSAVAGQADEVIPAEKTSEPNRDNNVPKRRYDLLLVAQPSSMSPAELDNLIEAIRTGQPTIVFEDPFPNPENFRHLSGRGTYWPRFISRDGTETCDIQKLWNALDLDIDTIRQGSQATPWLVWQLAAANPYPRDPFLNLPEQIVVRGQSQINETHPATRNIDELCFQYTGYLRKDLKSALEFDFLVETGRAGRVPQLLFWETAARLGLFSSQAEAELQNRRGAPDSNYYLAAHILGRDAKQALIEKKPAAKSNTNVVYICDVDVLADHFVDLRDYPFQNGIAYNIQNVSFVLNLVDWMLGEEVYLSLRNRRIRHMTLQVVEKTTETAMQTVYNETQQLAKDRITAEAEIQSRMNAEIEPLRNEIKSLQSKRDKGEPIDSVALDAKTRLLQSIQMQQQQRLAQKREEFENSRVEKLRSIQLDADNEIQQIQKKFKLYAVFVPPIPPLLVGLIVFVRRRLREREGISKARRLK